MQPRIYTYKITFEEVPYYYYGSKKEKHFNQEYWGSPVTNKWCWELYTPKKQILELFDFTDDGYEECRKVENRLIKPVLNDPWCLNESCCNYCSLKILRRAGKKAAETNMKNKTSIFALSPEQRIENSKKANKISKELGVGIYSLTSEQLSKNAKKAKQLGTGMFSLSKEQRKEVVKKSLETQKQNGTGIYSLTPEKRSEIGKKGSQRAKELGVGIFALTKEQCRENVKKVHSQRWQCTETGFVTNAGSLSNYQKKRGIDTSKRKRIE